MQGRNNSDIVVSKMEMRSSEEWHWKSTSKNSTEHKQNKRLLRYTAIFAVVSLLVGAGGSLIMHHPERAQAVMGHLRAEFEYDEMLGRLQFVSHLLPEGAMVFLNEEKDDKELVSSIPTGAQLFHAWSQEEPWLEYSCEGEIKVCQDGQVAAIVKNRENEYTVRISHPNGYESLYSGLKAIQIEEYETVYKGQQLGISAGYTAFEWRKDGLSILPMQNSYESMIKEI